MTQNVTSDGRSLVHTTDADAMRDHGALTMLGQIAARTAHEINNPLAGIQNAFLLLRAAIPETHPHYHFAGAIDREIGRIAAVTRQLYETYRPDHSLELSASLIHAIGDAVSFVGATWPNGARRIVTDLATAPATVPMPDALLRQLLYNVLENAVEHTPSGEVVVIRVTAESFCVITVTDGGPGFPADVRASLAGPYPGHAAFARRAGGKGIGLMLIRQSVHAVGGALEVRDRDDGQRGSIVEIRLPMTPMTPTTSEIAR